MTVGKSRPGYDVKALVTFYMVIKPKPTLGFECELGGETVEPGRLTWLLQ